MKIVKDRIKIYSSPKELPIGRYSDFQKYLIQNINIEDTLNRAKAFSEEGRSEDCAKEINNAILSLNELKNGVNVGSYPFAILVAEIDGKQANDTTVDGLNLVIERLTEIGITQQDIDESVEDVKKK